MLSLCLQEAEEGQKRMQERVARFRQTLLEERTADDDVMLPRFWMEVYNREGATRGKVEQQLG